VPSLPKLVFTILSAEAERDRTRDERVVVDQPCWGEEGAVRSEAARSGRPIATTETPRGCGVWTIGPIHRQLGWKE
jgi:hypothetical protein